MSAPARDLAAEFQVEFILPSEFPRRVYPRSPRYEAGPPAGDAIANKGEK